MAVSEADRHQLIRLLSDAITPEGAAILMEHLPPVGWADVATKRDLDVLEERMDARFAMVEARFDARFAKVEARFDAIDHRFEGLDHRFDAIDHRFEGLDHRFEGLEHRLRAAISDSASELRKEMMNQTRTFVIANTASIISAVTLAFVAARFG